MTKYDSHIKDYEEMYFLMWMCNDDQNIDYKIFIYLFEYFNDV